MAVQAPDRKRMAAAGRYLLHRVYLSLTSGGVAIVDDRMTRKVSNLQDGDRGPFEPREYGTPKSAWFLGLKHPVFSVIVPFPSDER
jgi:hypothetical protein